MKIKNVAVSGILSFTYLFAAILLCLLIDALLLMVLDKIILIPFPVQTIIRLVIYTVGVPAIAGFVAYHEGYQTATCTVADSVLGMGLSVILQLLLSLLFHFHAFIAGGVRFAAGLLFMGMNVSFEGIAETPVELFLGVFLLYTALYATVLTACRMKGTRLRLGERAELNLG